MDDRIAAERELFARLSIEEMEEVAAETEALVAKVRMMAQRNRVLPAGATLPGTSMENRESTTGESPENSAPATSTMGSGPPAFAFELQPTIRSRKELQSRFSITSSRGIPSQEFTPDARRCRQSRRILATSSCQFGSDVHLGRERQMDRAAIGNRQQPRTLFLVEDAFKLDVSFNKREGGRARFAIRTIFSVDARMTEANRDTF